MKKGTLALSLLAILVVCLAGSGLFAHCEIPCGIYDDQMRIKMILEDITTIEKSMNEIVKLEQKKNHNMNQLVRWIINKDKHANKIQNIVYQYFMTQRIIPEQKNYDKKLELLHQMLIFSMKCKQTTDIVYVNKLRNCVDDFEKIYFENMKK